MKKYLPILAALGLVVALDRPASSLGQDFGMDEPHSRAHQTEFYLLGQDRHAEDTVARNREIDLAPGPNPPMATGDIHFHADDAAFWGFGIGYNINDHLNVNAEFTFGYPNYTVEFQNARLNGEAFVQSGKFNAEYNVLSGPITPFISGGLGYLFIDTGIPSGPPSYYCWWDDWWGETCVGTTPTYTETYFTLNAAVGLRWDINDEMMLKVYAISNWVDVPSASDWMTTVQISVALGWKF